MRSVASTCLRVALLFAAVVSTGAAEVPARVGLPLQRVDHRELPPLDLAPFLEADAARAAELSAPLRVGIERQVDLAPASSGTWEALPGGGRLWRVRVTSPGARWLVLGFSAFRPGSAELVVHDPMGRNVHGPYTRNDARAHGQLWVPPLPGDSAVVELRWPAHARDETVVRLSTISHGYRKLWDEERPFADDDVGETGSLGAGSCNVDVNCAAGDGFDDAKRAVVQLLYRGSAFCTGALINTTAGDCRPYVLTAAHCVADEEAAASVIFRFGHERPFCEAGAPPAGLFASGARRLAAHAASDSALLEIEGELPADADAYFAGWDRSTVPPPESWTIHHPRGDVKKISYEAQTLVSGQPTGWGVSHWRVTGWELGTTEPGSSGAPLLNSAGRILGQLHGGIASCSTDGWDEFGKFLVGWTGGGSPPTRLADWLDPLGTNPTALDGIDLATCLEPRPRLEPTGFTLDDGAGDADGAAEPGETVAMVVRLSNRGNLAATAVVGSLAASSPSVAEVEETASWPSIATGAEESTVPPHFRLALDPALPCGAAVPLTLEVHSAESGNQTFHLELRSGVESVAPLFADDMEAENPAWEVIDAGWSRAGLDSASGSTSWTVEAPSAAISSDLLLHLTGPLPAGSRLRFQHRHNTERGGDGGVIEYSLDGGAAWHDAEALIVAGGYGGTLSGGSALAGRAAWTGDSAGWREVRVDLASLAGESTLLRWRFATNGSVADEGWFVDDVVVESVSHHCDAAPDHRAVRTIGSTPRRRALQPRLPRTR